MTTLHIDFQGPAPYTMQFLEKRPLPGKAPPNALPRARNSRTPRLTFDGVDPGLYLVDMRAARRRERRWIAVENAVTIVHTRPPVEGQNATRRNGQQVESWQPVEPEEELFGVLFVPGGTLSDDFLEAFQLKPIRFDEPDAARVGLQGVLLRSRPNESAEQAGNPDEQHARTLEALRRHPAVASAGPVHRGSIDFSIFKPRINVQFRPGVSRRDAEFLIAQVQPEHVRRSQLGPRRYVLDYALSAGREINRRVEHLALDPRVASVEPGFGERPVLHTPGDVLWPLLWDRRWMGWPAAWALVEATPAPVVHVLDTGFVGIEGSTELDITGETSGSGRHGIFSMGLISAALDADGTVGISPGSPLVGVVYDTGGEFKMTPGSIIPGADPQVPHDADILSASLGIHGELLEAVLSLIQAAARKGRGGRGLLQFYSAGDNNLIPPPGPGEPPLLLPGGVVDGNSFGAAPFAFTTAAVMLDEQPVDLTSPTEPSPAVPQIKFPPGNFGPEVDWVALGPDANHRRVWTADGLFDGEMPTNDAAKIVIGNPQGGGYQYTGGRPTTVEPFNLAVTLPIQLNSKTFTVTAVDPVNQVVTFNSTAVLPNNTEVLLGGLELGIVVETAGVLGINWHAAIPNEHDTFALVKASGALHTVGFDPSTVSSTTLDSILNGVAANAGNPILRFGVGARQHGGTSAANSVASGIGALVLRANPQLTFREVEEILKTTAVAVTPALQAADLLISNPTLDDVAQANLHAFGAGRLDAFGAVSLALEYRQERADLHIRDSLDDLGNGAAAPAGISPDIWVRHVGVIYADSQDPSPPGGAVSVDYAIDDQHQEPVFGADNRAYVRIRNRGNRTSPQARVILRVARASEGPFDWPDIWTVEDDARVLTIGDPIELDPMAPEEVCIVEFVWTAADMLDINAHPNPYLLAEITPQDGRLAEPQVHRNTNLAVRPVTMNAGAGGPTLDWLDDVGQPLGFVTPPDSAFSCRVHVPGGQVAQAYFRAHGRRRSDDLSEAINASAATWNNAEQAYDLTVNIPAYWAEFVLEAELIDNLGRHAPADQRFHRLGVRLPIELTLLLDYSGSMRSSAGTLSKWGAARQAALLFKHLFDQLGDSSTDTLKARYFYHDGSSQAPEVAVNALPPADPPGNHWTPLGDPISEANADFTSGADRERVIVLLTDGKENRGDVRLADIRVEPTLASGEPISVNKNADTGIRIHACAFGSPGTVDTDALEGLVHGTDDPTLQHFAGRLHSTENLDNPDDASALTEMFLSIVADVTGTEVIGPIRANGEAFDIEPGVDQFIFVAPAGPSTMSLTRQGGPTVDIDDIAPGVPGYVQASVLGTSNTAGRWTLSGSPAADCFVLVDLQLTSELTVEPTAHGGFECAVRLLFAGQPITDARCELTARGPGEALGEVIANAGATLRPQPKSDLSMRARLVQDALKRRSIPLRIARNVHLLQPTGAGRFATLLDGPLRTGTWSFELRITGQTPSGSPFERLVRASRVVTAQPIAATSQVDWTTLPDGSQRAVIVPRDRRGDRLGPGLDLTSLIGQSRQRLIDQGDGTYAASPRKARDAIRLSPRLGARLVHPPRLRLFAVKVTLVEVRTPARRGSKRWVFLAAAHLGRRRKGTRLPARGHHEIRSGTSLSPNRVVFDDRVREGEALRVQFSALELGAGIQWLKNLRPPRNGVSPVGRDTLILKGDPRAWTGSHHIRTPHWQAEFYVEIDG